MGGFCAESTIAASRRYELGRPEEGATLTFLDWQWAEWDRCRLVWADHGCPRAAALGARQIGSAHTLCDFNNMAPDDG